MKQHDDARTADGSDVESWRPSQPSSVSVVKDARAWALRVLPRLLDRRARPYLEDDVELMVSELTANAVEHAGGVNRVDMRRTASVIRISVHDPSPAVPKPATSLQADSDRGRGTLLMQQLALAWGVTPHQGNGKDVWLDLAL